MSRISEPFESAPRRWFPHRRQRIVVACVACGRNFTSAMHLERHHEASTRPLWERAFWVRPNSRALEIPAQRTEPRAGGPGVLGAQRPSESPRGGGRRSRREGA